MDGAKDNEISGAGARFLFKGDLSGMLQKIAGYPLANVDITEPTLEEIFMHYYAE